MATEWYYAIDGVQYGPVSAQGLKSLADSKKLLPAHLLWKNGLKTWVNAQNVNGLFTICVDAVSLLPQIPPLREKVILIKLEDEGKNDKNLSASLPKIAKKLSIEVSPNPPNADISYQKIKPAQTPAKSSKISHFFSSAIYCVVVMIAIVAIFLPFKVIIFEAAMVMTGLWGLITGKIWLVSDKYTLKLSTARGIGALLFFPVPLLLIGVFMIDEYGYINNLKPFLGLIEIGIFSTIAVVAYFIYRISRQIK